MDRMINGFLMTLLCWLTSCIIGTLLFNVIVPPDGSPLTTFDGLVFIAIGWIICNRINKGEDYQTSFNIWMTILYIPTLLSIL